MVLFTITCTTCKAKLKVRDGAAIGQILGCPKCGSMVHVAAPEGWKPPDLAPGMQQTVDDSGRFGDPKLEPAVDPAVSANGGKKPRSRWRDQVESPREGGVNDNEVAANDIADAGGDVAAAGTLPAAAWIKWGLCAGGTLVGVSLLFGGWISWGGSHSNPLPVLPGVDVPEVEAPQEGPTEPIPAAAVAQESAPARVPLDPRWLPSAAESVLSIQPSGLRRQPEAQVVLGRTSTLWDPAFATLFAAFPFAPADIRRLTWATTDLAAARGDDWLAAGLVIVELERPVAERKEWLDGCDSLDWKLGESVCRSLPATDWPHPFAVVGERTIVTGPADVMKALADRGGPRTAQTEFEHLVDRLDAGGDLLWALDLAALRANDAMPAWPPLIEMWHVERDDWRVVRELPKAAGLGLRLDERLRMELLFACDGETSAEQFEHAIGRVVAAVEKTLAGESEVLTRKLRAGEITTADAGQLKLLFSATREALKLREFERDGAIVRLTAPWGGDWSTVALAAVASVPELESSRLSTARVLDEDHHRQLLEAIDGYAKAEGSFPAGAGGAMLLPPENRLSWIATLLPYYGRLDWHGELSFGRPWNEATNAQVARRPFDLVINPALGPSQTKAAFPVTHYVGITGLGLGAGKLEADDPRAGLFGYNRRSTPEQIGDGASHTIAVMGVSGNLGAWAAGGEATVRPLTARPYVNGPDGFGSGQPNGMLVGMADGSVRFISNDVDPGVLERMVTINGGETTPDLTEEVERIAGTDTDADHVDDPEARDDAEPPAADGVEDQPAVATRPVRPDAEITARLADTIPAIEFDKVPLVDVIRVLSDFSTLEISLDVESLAEMGIKPDVRVTLRLQDASVEEVLNAALAQFKLSYVLADGHVLVTNPGRLKDTLQTRRFDVGDLAGGGHAAVEELAALVRQLVQPTTWQESGGEGHVRAAKGALEVAQTETVEQYVAIFLDKLRLARSRRVTSQTKSGELTLETRHAMAKTRLDQLVTVNFSEPTPLAKIVGQLEKSSKTKMVFDGPGMAEAGVSPQVEAKLSVDRRPLSEALAALLDPLRLAYRAVDARSLQITARKVADERLELEFYRIGDVLDEELMADALRERVLDELAPKTWSESGGPGVLYYDTASSCLIVLQSQGVQIELEQLLDTLRAAKK